MFGLLKKAVSGLVSGIKKKVEAKEEKAGEPTLSENGGEPAHSGEFAGTEQKTHQQPARPEKIREVPIGPQQQETGRAGIAGRLLGRIVGAAGAVKKKIEEKEIKNEDVDELLWNFQLTLVQANIASEVAEKLCSDVKKNLAGTRVKRNREIGELVRRSLKESVLEILDADGIDLAEAVLDGDKPAVIVFLGVNGVGKTLCIAKVAKYLAGKKISSIMAAADTFRAGSIQQLEQHGANIGVKVVRHDYGSDAAAVCFDAIQSARARGIDTVLVDTAGRLQSNKALMEELKKIVRVAKPRLKIFVGDSLTGGDLVSQCDIFNREIGIDGIILTKADVDEKGGAAISAVHASKRPILFLGTGQGYDDLAPFEPKKFVESLFPEEH